MAQIEEPPRHFSIQESVGGLAAVAGDIATGLVFCGACSLSSNLTGQAASWRVQLLEKQRRQRQMSQRLAMLQCYRPAEVTWPIVDIHGDTLISLPEDAALAIANPLAGLSGADSGIVPGQSDGLGLVGFVVAV